MVTLASRIGAARAVHSTRAASRVSVLENCFPPSCTTLITSHQAQIFHNLMDEKLNAQNEQKRFVFTRT